MKLAAIIFTLLCFFSCRKRESAGPVQIPSVQDSAMQVIGVAKKDINEFDVTVKISPSQGEIYSNIYFQWSSKADFSEDLDSLLVSGNVSSATQNLLHLVKLKQATVYYGRISMIFNNTKFLSPITQWTTDSLKLSLVAYPEATTSFARGEEVRIRTNFTGGLNTQIGAKVLLGDDSCTVIYDDGEQIRFNVPTEIPSGKYLIELRRKGLTGYVQDSIEVLRGDWSETNGPVFQIPYFADPFTPNGLYFFGTCYNKSTGWIVGGRWFNGAISSEVPETGMSGSIYQFDAYQKQWTKRTPTNRQYLENVIPYYYNNNIYVLSGQQTDWTDLGYTWESHMRIINRMKRLELNSLTWYEMDTLPYTNARFLTSFELNNEWYIGMGVKWDSLNPSTGNPYPLNKFWKYNPANNVWTRLADFPGSYQRNPTCFSIGEKAYAFYGAIPIGDPNTATTFNQEFWEYDPTSNSWRQLNLPNSSRPLPGEKYQIFTHNGKAYFLTAQKRELFYYYYGYVMQNHCLEFDPATGTFKRIAHMPSPNLLRLIGNIDNTYFFYSDTFGYYDALPNKTYQFTVE